MGAKKEKKREEKRFGILHSVKIFVKLTFLENDDIGNRLFQK